MVQIIKKISLEVSKPNIIQAIVAKQYDNNSRFLQVTLMHEGKKIEIAPTSTVIINAKRADGEEKPFAGEANNDGTATVPLTYWMLEIEGEVSCDVSVIDTEGRKLTSTKFDLQVEKASCRSGDITDDDNYDILVRLIEDVNKVKPDLEFDPESENAQSGIAVAQAIKQGEQWEIINTITLEENSATVLFDKDSNGSEFTLKSFYIKALVGVESPSDTKLFVAVAPALTGILGGLKQPEKIGSLATTLRTWGCGLYDNIFALEGTTIANSNDFPNPNVTETKVVSIPPYARIKTIGIKRISVSATKTSVNDAGNLVSGSTFELWGVRK